MKQQKYLKRTLYGEVFIKMCIFAATLKGNYIIP